MEETDMQDRFANYNNYFMYTVYVKDKYDAEYRTAIAAQLAAEHVKCTTYDDSPCIDIEVDPGFAEDPETLIPLLSLLLGYANRFVYGTLVEYAFADGDSYGIVDIDVREGLEQLFEMQRNA